MDLTKLDLKELDKLSPAEKQLAFSILKEYADKGKSEKLEQLLLEDYEEIPVSIEEFLHNPDYLGNGLVNDEGKFTVFPYWVNILNEVFPNSFDTTYNTLVLSGAIGLGKSFVAVICMLYMLYRMLCLKDPYKHFGLQPIDHITFSIMNITLDAAKGVAWAKLQELVQLSPWFLNHGRMSKSVVNPEWQPDKNIELIFGSQPRHVIGRAVFCLAGDTEIVTEKGIVKIEDAVDTDLRVYSKTVDGQIILSDICTVKPTVKTNDYYEIELDDGTIIKCTPNHRFLLKDGTYKEAKDLTEQDDLEDSKPFGYIYSITNIINGKRYIGASIHPKRRFTEHIWSATHESSPGYNYPLHRAIRKYGENNFNLEVIDFAYTKKSLDLLEQKYIKEYNTQKIELGYNIADGGQGGDGGPIIREKISKKLKGRKLSEEHRKKLSEVNKGKTLPQNVREKISKKNKGKKVSEDTRRKMSEAGKHRDRSHYPSTKGWRWITDGIETHRVKPDTQLPEGWYYGNMLTSGKHDTSHWTKEMHETRSKLSSGKNNGMYGKGYLRKGGNNTNATIRYFYEDKVFECRNDLLAYLKTAMDSRVSANAIRQTVNGKAGVRIRKKFPFLLEKLKWEVKRNAD